MARKKKKLAAGPVASRTVDSLGPEARLEYIRAVCADRTSTLTPRAKLILVAMAAHGKPLTLDELAVALGEKWKDQLPP